MSVYADIITWSVNLPLWQRDALRRLAKGALQPADLDAILKMCGQEANGIALVPAAVPIDATHVPAGPAAGAPVCVSGVSSNKSVNALVDDQTLTFGPAGVTAVYGDNGAGKSGFARVLRHACQARGQDDAVLSNVYSTTAGAPSATVSYEVGGVAHQWGWSLAGSGPSDLARVAVFDSLAAAELVETENAIIWVPGGLDLLEQLARTVDAVRRRLDEAATGLAHPGPLPQVAPGTAAHNLLARLTGDTPASAIDALNVSEAERAELVVLDQAIAAPDPAAAAGQLRQRAARLRALGGRVTALEQAFGASGIAGLAQLRQGYETAVNAEVLLAKNTFGDSVVPGVGEAAWHALWQAAENYAKAGATSDRVFPSAADPAHCVLCQQPLAAPARDRMGRFHAFVRADAARRRATASAALAQALTQRRALRPSEAGDAGVVAEVTELDATNGPNLANWLHAAQAAWTAVSALTAGTSPWSLPAAVPEGWADWLEARAKEVDAQASALGQAADPAARAAQIRTRDELKARALLLQGRTQVDAEIERLKKRNKVARASAACVTTGITRKSGELTKQHVSDQLVAAFAAEATALRLPQTVAYSPSRNEKGTSYQQMTLLSAPWATKVGQPVRVLSEGERRAVALAAFLAEVVTRGDLSAVVLDDPVSSLDHDRRRTVAERLAEVARTRQVVVFTHDLVFLHMLKSAAEDAGVPVTDREVRRAGASAGYCRQKAPAKATPVKALVGELKAHAQACAVLHRAGDVDVYERDLTQGYGLLREAWERAVEELLFNQAVMRFGHTVQTSRLKKVNDITQADLDTIDAGMTICSKWLPGHAQATAQNEPLPRPADFSGEVGRLDTFMTAMRQRGRN